MEAAIPAAARFSAGPALPARADVPGRAPNAVLGMLIFLGTELMFFAGLVSALLILRSAAPAWPPLGQPRLPVAVTALNTLLLLFSGYTMWTAVRAGHRPEQRQRLVATAALGVLFVAIQGSEWIRLIHYGLRVSSGTFGSTFYTLIGAHAVHVLGGVIVLLATVRRVATPADATRGRLLAAALYWFFVVGIWPVLYALVYLA